MNKNVCNHEVRTVVISGNTKTYCQKCLCTLSGTKDEFPTKTYAEILHLMCAALPDADAEKE